MSCLGPSFLFDGLGEGGRHRRVRTRGLWTPWFLLQEEDPAEVLPIG
jgi:hypothetical protein